MFCFLQSTADKNNQMRALCQIFQLVSRECCGCVQVAILEEYMEWG